MVKAKIKKKDKKDKKSKKKRIKRKPLTPKQKKEKLLRRRLFWVREQLVKAEGSSRYHYVRYNNLSISHKQWRKRKDRWKEAEAEVDHWKFEISRLNELLDYVTE